MTRFLTSREVMPLLNYRSLKAFNRAVHRDGIPHKYDAGGRLAFDPARLEAWRQTFKPKKRGPKRRALRVVEAA